MDVNVLGPDGYVSSWLCAPSELAAAGADLTGEVLALAPSRDELRLVSAERDDLGAVLDECLSAYQEAPRQLSPVPFSVRPDGVRPWDPPADHPVRLKVELAVRYLALVEYTYQQQHLQRLFEKVGEDVFVATYSLTELRGGGYRSRSGWVKQVTAALLPRTDTIIFIDNETKDIFEVAWEAVEAIVGEHLIEDTGYNPPRWRVGTWPPDVMVEALRQRAIPKEG